MKPILSLLYTVAIIFSTADLAEPSRLKVEVRAKPVVSSEKITLGDIAKISGNGETQEEEVKKAESIFLTHFPPMIKSKTISKGMIASALKQNRIKVAKADLVSPDIIKISRRQMIVKADHIQEAARNYIEEVLQGISGEAVITSLNHKDGDISVPEGELAFEFQPINQSLFAGRISFHMNLLVDGKTVERIDMKAHVEVTREIAVAVKAVRKGQVLGPEDFVMKKRVVKRENPNLMTDPEEVTGMRAKRLIPGNSIIQAYMLDRPHLVKKKDRVKIIVESRFLKISTVGIAKESGSKGSYIRVMNLDSKKIIVAEVVSEKLVRVDF